MIDHSKIGRNDPCPCGSGKKYKKCHGKNHSDVNVIVEQELEQVQLDMMRWALAEHKDEIDAYLAPYYERLGLADEAKRMFQFFGATWYMTCALREGKTLIQEYIDLHKDQIRRTSVLENMQSWGQIVPSVFRINAWNGAYVETEDWFTKEKNVVKTSGAQQAEKESGLGIGTILPAGTGAIFLATFFHVPESSGEVEPIERDLVKLFDQSETVNPKEFMASSFLDVLESFMFSEEEIAEAGDSPAAEAAASVETEKENGPVWEAPDHEEVAQAFHAYALGYDMPSEAEELGIKLWHTYCQRVQPKLRKPEVAVAALVYLVDSIIGDGTVTQAELARLYEISSTSISSRYKSMCQELESEIAEVESLGAVGVR